MLSSQSGNSSNGKEQLEYQQVIKVSRQQMYVERIPDDI
jgi:hypothetical protein